MGFFSRLMGVQGNSSQQELARAVSNLIARIDILYSLAHDMDVDYGFSGVYSISSSVRMDLLSFALHIAASDGVLEQNEVNAINTLLSANFTYADCKEIIEETDFATKGFNSLVPITFKLLTELAKAHPDIAREFAEGLASTYREIGLVVAAADGYIDSRERRNLDDFTDMLYRYIRSI